MGPSWWQLTEGGTELLDIAVEVVVVGVEVVLVVVVVEVVVVDVVDDDGGCGVPLQVEVSSGKLQLRMSGSNTVPSEHFIECSLVMAQK